MHEKARGSVQQIDLRPLGIHEFGAMKSRGFGRPTTPAHCELFFDGKPMTLARWPNEGEWAQIAGFPEAQAQNDGHGGKIGRLEDGFSFSGDRPLGWKDTSDLWVHGYWSWDWANSYERVASLDREQRLIKTAPPHGQYGFRKGQRFYFLNVLEELDQPGEWFLDREAGMLYFWPPKGPGENSPTHAVAARPTAAAAERRLARHVPGPDARSDARRRRRHSRRHAAIASPAARSATSATGASVSRAGPATAWRVATSSTPATAAWC